jgi:hypothetical protein
MSKKEVKKIDPTLINFSFEPIKRAYVPRNNERKTYKIERGTHVNGSINNKIPTMKIVRGDLVNAEPKKDLDYYINQNNIGYRKRREYKPKTQTKLENLSIKFIKGSKYSIKSVIESTAIVPTEIVPTEIIRPINQFEGCIQYIRDDDDDDKIIVKEKVTLSVIKKEKVSYNPDLYQKLCVSKGKELVSRLSSIDCEVYADYLIKYICDVKEDDNFDWLEESEYGLGLKYLVKDKYDQQYAMINVFISHLNKLKFPKVNNTYLVVILFNKLLTKEIVEVDILLDWKDSDDDCVGKMKALVQTSEWYLNLLAFLDEVDEESDNEGML